MQMRSDAAKFEINLLAIFILTCISAFSCSQPGFPSTGLAQGKVFAHTGFHLHPPIPVQQYWSKTTLGKILQTHPVLKSRFSQVEFEQLPRPERNHRNENIVQQVRSPSNRRSRRPTRGLTPPEHREMKAAQTQGLQCSRCTLYLKQWGSSHGDYRGPWFIWHDFIHIITNIEWPRHAWTSCAHCLAPQPVAAVDSLFPLPLSSGKFKLIL